MRSVLAVNAICHSPAVCTALYRLKPFNVPSVAFDLVETTFDRGFESCLRSQTTLHFEFSALLVEIRSKGTVGKAEKSTGEIDAAYVLKTG